MVNLSLIEQCPSVLEKTHFENLAMPIFTDTRKYQQPGAFVAIPGAKVNPLDVMAGLLDAGCPYVFWEQGAENAPRVESLRLKYPKTMFIPVKDSVIFLQEISRLHIEEWKLKSNNKTVFAISGSNGKTTHKEMLSFILKSVLPGKVVATEKNNNNHLGVPLTLLEVRDETEIVVLELGSNHPGEIKVLCDIASPNAGLITNIGATHMEFFGTEEKVFEEEGYLYHAVKSETAGKGFFLINVDDPFLKRFPVTPGSVTYGQDSHSMARVSYLETGAQIKFQGIDLLALNNHITGKHNKLNLVTCLFIAHHFFPHDKVKLTEAALGFQPTKNRSEWIKFEEKSIFLDAYNANPSSMKVALEGFKDSVIEQGFDLSDACVVLGDMNELGDSTPQYHKEVGHFVKELGFENVFFVGRYAPYYISGNPQGAAKASSADFKKEYRSDCLRKYPIHFIKGSRSLQLESLFDIT
ncbi:MAG TPA: UDP-N-acetylmuramoyl-tripeptide--D-alanyl-D-alanine ligase [Bacteriovoracaceae bacterium]|nr:UDP-N-acetylmuramoyl-tripeptide--D-alanyl-D-alanine ligase [Bacteriovoracaceae bacterium]